MEPLTLGRIGLSFEQSFLNAGEKVLRLEPDYDSLDSLVATSDEEGISKTISFIGPTHEGKSFLIRMLMGGDSVEHAPQSSDPDSDDLRPTSSDVRCYRAEDGANFLDLEGDAGGDLLPLEIQSQILSVDDTGTEMSKDDAIQKYYQLRRDSVKEHLPRLAYVLSDVLVLVSSQDFSSHYYKDMVKTVAMTAALNGVVNCEMPCLLLVQNKTNKRKTFDVEKLTQQFMRSHDRHGSLLQYYADVKCARIPDADFFDSEESFLEACQPFRKTVESLLVQRCETRVELGNDYSQRVWACLTAETLRQFHSRQGLRMGQILTETMLQKQHQILGRVIPFFGAVNLAPTKEAYIKARQASLRAMAAYYAKELVTTKDPLSERTVEERQEDMLRQLDADTRVLLESISRVQPCESVASDGRMCTSVRCNHARTRHFNPKAMKSKRGGFLRTIKKKLGTSKADKHSKTEWKGRFVFSDPQTSDELLSIVKEAREMLEALDDPNMIIFALAENLRDALSSHSQVTDIVWPYSCFLCMENEAGVAWPCMHHFCESCTWALRSLSEANAEVRHNGLFDPSLLINVDLCPVCKKATFTPTVASGTDQEASQEKLRSRRADSARDKSILNVTSRDRTQPSPSRPFSSSSDEVVLSEPKKIHSHVKKGIWIVEVEWPNGVCNWIPISTIAHTKKCKRYIRHHARLRKALEAEAQKAKERKERRTL